MKMSLLSTVFMIMVALAFIFVSDQGESLDITKVIQGTVKEVKVRSIKILDDSSSKQVQMAMDANTVYDNVQNGTDLKAGDKVQIEYQTNHHKNIAITITKREVQS